MSFSQHGEDAWAVSQFEPGFLGWALEVGAHDGLTMSNTKLLEDAGWNVLCVEPNPQVATRLRANRKLVWIGACGSEHRSLPFYIYRPEPTWSSLQRGVLTPDAGPNPPDEWDEIEVEVETINRLLLLYAFPQLDLLSVDTEGTELDVLEGIDLDRWCPRVIICESWEARSPVVDYLEQRDYDRVERLSVNDLFIRRSP